jgi:hypothetical protein
VKIGRPGIPGIKPRISDPGFIPVVSKKSGNEIEKSGNGIGNRETRPGNWETGSGTETGPVSSIYIII